MLKRRGEKQGQKYHIRHGLVNELGVRMFVQLPELPAARDFKFVAATASPCQSNRNVNQASKCNEKEMKNEP